MVIPCSKRSRIELWINAHGDLVITRWKNGEFGTIRVKVYKPTDDPQIPIKPITITSRGTIVIKL